MKLQYSRDRSFQKELQSRVDRHMAATGRPRHGGARIHAKTALLLTWAVSSYWALLTLPTRWFEALPLAVSLGLAIAGIGFNVFHDGNHGSYSGSRKLNRLMGWALDLLGGSSYVWRWKHNVFHHSFPNVHGLDDDVDLGELCRMSQDQPHRPYHRLQHIYMWPLYGLLAAKWHFIDDFVAVARGQIGDHPFPRPRGLDLAAFIGGKLAFFAWTFVLPSFFFSVPLVILFYFLVTGVQSVMMSAVFQLAHANGESNWLTLEKTAGEVQTEWAIHQVETTVDFARGNRLLTWYTGGLNHQVEHHLFPTLSHLHLPAIAGIVQEVCKEQGVTYNEHPTLWAALLSHQRWLRSMGKPESSPIAKAA